VVLGAGRAETYPGSAAPNTKRHARELLPSERRTLVSGTRAEEALVLTPPSIAHTEEDPLRRRLMSRNVLNLQ
jgi:hypothetical protein